ncbi:MAG: hypothetical protein E7774_16060 [Bradyrhizobium sp.]|nr:MAG: hypothetical protein E7774_16060 [Bradyrhizobium sp.]
MVAAIWRPLPSPDLPALTEARLQAHYAAQWLGRAARAFAPSQADDSHTSLAWNDAFDGFVTHPLQPGLRLGLRLHDLTLALLRDGVESPASSFSLIGGGEREAGERLSALLRAEGLDPKGLAAPSPYAMPTHALAEGGHYGGPRLERSLAEIAGWFANANVSVDRLRGAILERGFTAPPPRCWPHHFDLATLTSFAIPGGDKTAYIGAGLSPGDHFYDEPYYYLSIYPAPALQSLPALPELGFWHDKEFFAAVTTARRIAARPNPQADTDAFLAAALSAAFDCFRPLR